MRLNQKTVRVVFFILAFISLLAALPAAAKRSTIELRLVAQSGGTQFRTSDGATMRLEAPLVALPAGALEARAVDTAVEVTLSPAVAREFAAATAKNVGRSLAIVVDGVVQSAPVIRDEVVGGRVSITVRDAAKARELAARLGAPATSTTPADK